MSEEGEQQLAELREVLAKPEVRIELGTALSISMGAMPCARLFEKNLATGRWKRADVPMLVPPENGTRADLLRMLAETLEPSASRLASMEEE